ncbi:LOW QUALITY PROTEIN: hypothetical protein U9M48_043406 [Paspalum notatum var. saurae]|uniref:DUF4283 domain-containing protein n=1 Tax=Paspalum notatum var. saurae TaxID=547442 RepID=A0AAQ3USP5_PASNO
MARSGDPADRPEQSCAVASSTSDIERELERLSSYAWCVSAVTAPTSAWNGWSGDFLVTFTHNHHREAAVAARDFPHGNLDFRIRPWQLVALGDHHDLCFQNESIAKHSVAQACVLDYIEEDCLSPNKVDTRYLNLWVWTRYPSNIPKIIWLTITGQTMAIHDDAPPPLGQCGLTFGVLVHIDLVESLPGHDG